MGYVLDREHQDGNNFEATGVVEHRIELRVDHINNEPKIEPLRYDLDFEEAALESGHVPEDCGRRTRA